MLLQKCVPRIVQQTLSMSSWVEGKIVVSKEELNLDLSLLGGQSFRWEKQTNDEGVSKWQGVAYNCFWELSQTPEQISYKAFSSSKHPEDFHNTLLHKYFRLNFDLNASCEKWKTAHQHFADTSSSLKAVRVLDQEPLETIISFICSQNNHIKRISTMVQWLCSKYGEEICTHEGRTHYTFPSLTALHTHQNSALRAAKFGYRAKFISGSVQRIHDCGGTEWFQKLRKLPYKEARVELVSLPGIGFKVADCICLMALNHLESVPIDTHIFKIAQRSYMPQLSGVKAVTPKIYEEIADHFREVYGCYAGWAQAVLFCSGLQQFQDTKATDSAPKKKRKK